MPVRVREEIQALPRALGLSRPKIASNAFSTVEEALFRTSGEVARQGDQQRAVARIARGTSVKPEDIQFHLLAAILYRRFVLGPNGVAMTRNENPAAASATSR